MYWQHGGVFPYHTNGYDQLKAMAAKYKMPLVYFQQYENDATFFADNLDHPGERGWVLFDKVLDDFYQGRLKTP